MSNKITTKSMRFNGGVGANVEGNQLEKRKHFIANFMGTTLDATNDWAAKVDNGTADDIALSETAGGSVLFTTGSADNDSEMLSTAVIYNGTKKAVGTCRVGITDVSGTALFVGFTDAKLESNNSIAIHYPDDALTTVASDAAGFVIDADSATLGASSLLCCGVKANSDATTVDTGITWADNEVKTLTVELDGTTAKFYVDGVQKGTVANAVTAATLLCFSIQAMTRAADGSNTVRVYRVETWVDET